MVDYIAIEYFVRSLWTIAKKVYFTPGYKHWQITCKLIKHNIFMFSRLIYYDLGDKFSDYAMDSIYLRYDFPLLYSGYADEGPWGCTDIGNCGWV